MDFSENFSDDSDEGRKFKTDFFDTRFRQLNDLLIGHANGSLHYLLAVNGGGAVLMLSLVGAVEHWRAERWPYVLLAVFIVGLLLLGAARVSLLLHTRHLLERFGIDGIRHRQGAISWTEFLDHDIERVRRFSFLPWAFGCASLFCFLVGCAAAGYLMAADLAGSKQPLGVSLKLSKTL